MHTLEIRVITEDGELVTTDTDFREDAAYEVFDSMLKTGCEGEIVQLIDNAGGNVLAEDRVGA